MRSSTPPTRPSPHQIHTPHNNTTSSSSSSSSSSSLSLSLSLLPPLPHLPSKQSPAADTHPNAAIVAASSVASSTVTALTVTAASPSAVPRPPLSPSSTPHGTQIDATGIMSDAATESRDDDPSAVRVKPDEVQMDPDTSTNSSSTPSSASTTAPATAPSQHNHTTLDFASRPLSTTHPTALPSAETSPGAQTTQPTSTVSTLQLASDALSNLPQSSSDAASVPTAAAELLSAIQRRNKKAPAIQSPHPGIIRSRSLATTPVPSSLLFGVKHDSLDVTAASSRATTPTRTPSGRAKRQRRERNPATPTTVSLSALPSIDQNDRRRSARVAKTVTTSASDSPSLPNLAMFGFSPYLENLVLNAKDSDRRTRSGARGFRPAIDRAPTKPKRSSTKNKTKDADPDGPDDDAKMELYHQLCIISYQLQADLDLVPHKSLAQLRAHFSTPSPENEDLRDPKLPSAAAAAAVPGTSLDPSRAATPVIDAESQDRQLAFTASTSAYTQPITIKAEPPQSPPLSLREPPPPRPPYSPESSPEVALMDSVRPTLHGGLQYNPNRSHDVYQPYAEQRPDLPPWSAKLDVPEDEPMSPEFRPARTNIMSISALMSGPSPSKAHTPTPELIQTPPRPPPLFMQQWTHDDEMASQFLQACADAIPKLDTTELDRLTQIAQLAAFDLEMLSVPSSPTPSLSPTTEQQQREAIAKFDPEQLNPLKTLDTQELYNREEAEYLTEMQTSNELYEGVRYLASFDEVVDEWRAGELARLRLQLEMRKAEVDRIWTCDRKLAWSTFVDNRAGELYRKAMIKASHSRWQAEMELDLLQVHRRKTRGLAKLTQDIWLPDVDGVEDAEVADVYRRHGKFVSAAKYSGQDDPLVRADIRKMRDALRVHKRQPLEEHAKGVEDQPDDQTQDAAKAEADVAPAEVNADAISVYDSASEQDDSDDYGAYDSDSSYASSASGISSLPSFTSIYSSPRVQSIADIDTAASDLDVLACEVASLRDGEADSDEDADESLWNRQIRLANQLAEQKLAQSAVASAVQTPVIAPVTDSEVVSAMPSRAASPVNSVKAQARKQRGTKRKKRPPPPGARLWKKGRVQQDTDGADGEQQVEEVPSQQQRNAEHASEAAYHQNGDVQQRDFQMVEQSAPTKSHAAEMQGADYHRDQQRALAPYGGYGMRPSYTAYDTGDDYRSFPPHEAYGARAYPAYPAHPADPYYPAYPQDAYAPNGASHYGHTPPPPLHHSHHGAAPSYAQYERGAYPTHPPPPRPQWPY